MQERFGRTALLLGEEALEKLAASRVAVFGLGGVGGYAAEALARAGVGTLDLIDSDRVDITNINRQIYALDNTVGEFKTEVAALRIHEINPEAKLHLHPVFFLPENAGDFDFTKYDYVIDAIDTVTAKLTLIECAKAAGTPVISAMGAGNKLDPAAFEVADIYKTSICPLAKVMRRECKKRGIDHLKVVYSKEPPLTPDRGEEPTGEEQNRTRRAVPGSVSFVPPVVGFIMAGEVVKDLIKEQLTGEIK